MTNASTIDTAVLDQMLKEIGNALMQADVNYQLVGKLRKNIKAKVNLEEMAAGHNKRKLIQQV